MEKMNIRKNKFVIILVIAMCGVILWGYVRFISPTRVAVLNFPDFTVEKLIRSNDNSFVKIKSINLEEAQKIKHYDMVLVRIHGTSMNAIHMDAIKKAIEKGVPVFSTESTNNEINSLTGRELEYISVLMENESAANFRSLFNYIRKKIDRKLLFNGRYEEPVLIPEDYFFHLGEDQFFATYEEYQSFYESSGKYKSDAPRVVLLAGNINMQNSNEEHMATLIQSLEEKGLNVYPINSFGVKKLDMIKNANPDIIINRPHGRLFMGGGESGVELLKTLNVPILAPVTVSEPYDDWLKSKQGMEGGSMTSMSVVLPELDGAIAPYAVAAQFERDGRFLFDAIPVHTEKFCRLVTNFVKLQTTPNKEKKVAIYYYKGTGKGAVSAADIEGVQSLFNTLKLLRDNGYDVAGLPDDAKSLEKMIQISGSVLGPYALGAYDEFLKKGNPELVDVEIFNEWATGQLPVGLLEEMKNRYGEAPGDYMSLEQNGKKYIAVARIKFGNVVILPQPMPSIGEDIDKLVHGTEGAPAYPYVASYLWTRNGFGADAIIHFGTHGSLEFIPGKQVALSDYDWTDVLISDMPHFYIYTINNIGEGIIAKRRSYATLISHLTAPFMQGELYGELDRLEQIVHNFSMLEEGGVKQNYRETIMKMALEQNILSALSIDSTKMINDKDIDRIHIYLEEIDGAKVTDGLYTLGQAYSKDNVENTIKLISIDPIKYALASIDAAQARININDMDDLTFVNRNYQNRADRLIRRALSGEKADKLLSESVSKEEYELFKKHQQQNDMANDQMIAMMQVMTQRMGDTTKAVKKKYLDEKGNIVEISESEQLLEKDNVPMVSMMDMMVQAQSESETIPIDSSDNNELLTALSDLYHAIDNIGKLSAELANSTVKEQEALLNALSGGYIAPSSAGDPIVNPAAIPTGKNFYSINPEATPSPEAWKMGKRLAESLLEAELESKGRYPEKVSFSLWATDFISSEGATVAQILYLLGVEPLRDGFGYIRSLRLIPVEQLGRPRIDVVVQTSGQLRDIAASRLELINRAVEMAAEDNSSDNYMRKGFADAERFLLEKGFSPVDARKYSKERVFGGVNGNYGTGIMGLVEKGDSWENQSQIAEQYISNMGAIYSANGTDEWGDVREGVFEAALLNTSVVVQPRSSNTWGPLSLDHVYEFMGGISAAVKHVTGNDPSGYFNDFRNTGRAKVQELKEAIGIETNSTIFNPKYITEMMKGEASAMDSFAETFRNTFGWNAMKPSAIDEHIWDELYDIYVSDSYGLELRETFEQKNPYALQEMTAVMLESARKEMWHPTEEQIKRMAEIHAELVHDYNAGCSGFVCDNAKLRNFISDNLDQQTARQYNSDVKDALEVRLESEQSDNGVILKKENIQTDDSVSSTDQQSVRDKNATPYIAAVILLLLFGWLVIKKRK